MGLSKIFSVALAFAVRTEKGRVDFPLFSTMLSAFLGVLSPFPNLVVVRKGPDATTLIEQKRFSSHLWVTCLFVPPVVGESY